MHRYVGWRAARRRRAHLRSSCAWRHHDGDVRRILFSVKLFARSARGLWLVFSRACEHGAAMGRWPVACCAGPGADDKRFQHTRTPLPLFLNCDLFLPGSSAASAVCMHPCVPKHVHVFLPWTRHGRYTANVCVQIIRNLSHLARRHTGAMWRTSHTVCPVPTFLTSKGFVLRPKLRLGCHKSSCPHLLRRDVNSAAAPKALSALCAS